MSEQATPPPPPAPSGAPVPPPATDGVATPPPSGGPVPEPKKPSVAGGIVRRLVGAVVVFAVLALGGLAWKYLTGAPETATVGDCLVGQSADKLKKVDCGDATAEWKVAGKVEDKSEAEANDVDAMCSAYPPAEVAYWEGKTGGKGYVLCLEPLKK